MEVKDIYADAVNAYGIDSQLNVLQEECAELIVAVSHYRRFRNIDELVEEMADVKIMLEQIELVMKLSRYIESIKQIKLKRLRERIDGDIKQPANIEPIIEKYKPGNDSECQMFVSKICAKCKKWDNKSACGIQSMSLILDIKDEQYPDAWTTKDGIPECAQFEKK